MKSSSKHLMKQSGEGNLVLQLRKGDSTSKKREREDTDSKDDGQVRYAFQKQYVQVNKQLKVRVNQLLLKNDNRPLKALWEALNDKDTPGIELPMAIVMDRRCGIERRAESDDNLAGSKGPLHVDSTPLMIAARVGRNDVVEALLAAGADPSARDNFGWTAYFVAAIYGNVTTMDLLVRYGADPFAVCDFFSSALHNVASKKGRADSLQRIVELGANTEDGDYYGRTPLILAAFLGDVPSIAAFLNIGANLEAVGRYGWTPLHCAIYMKHIGAIETLVWAGASVTAIDKGGRSPIEGLHRLCEHCTDADKARIIALLTPLH